MKRRTFVTGAAAAGVLAGWPAFGQEKFPSKPIEVVTHSGAGGGTDITARMMMVHAPAVLGTELVVANRVGGSGAAALAYAAGRPRDGHTILLITQSHLLTILQGKSAVKYEELVALARATADPQILMVGKSSPIKNAQDLVAAGKARKLKVGVTHIGSIDHITLVGFARKAGLQAPTAVPFRGGGDIVVNVVSGNIDLGMLNYAEAESQIKAGDVRPVMALSAKRLKVLPDVPTAKELGIDAQYDTVRGFVALKGTPEPVLKTLEDGLTKAMQGQMYTAYIDTSGQAPDSVAPRAAWQAQLDAMYKEAEAELKNLAAAAPAAAK
jgi:tripartite-type tricarboxylate transporter receptor subunit TctC